MATKSGSDRNPFKCTSCDCKYSSSSTSQNAPCTMNSCFHTLCVRCVTEKRRERGENQFVCFCDGCGKDSYVGEKPNLALTIIEIIRQIKSLSSSYFGDAHIKPSQLSSLKCLGCMESFSLTGDTVPKVLYCGHALCHICVAEKKRESGETSNPFVVTCPKCDVRTMFNNRNLFSEDIEDVIKWLEAKNEKVVHLETGHFDCAACGETAPCDKGISCSDCSNGQKRKPFVMCAFCAFYGHREHTTEKLLPSKLRLAKTLAILEIQSKLFNCNEEANGIMKEKKQLMDKVEKRFLRVIETIPSSSKYADGIKIGGSLKRKAEVYEDIMANIIPSAKEQNKMLREVLNQLEESFPDLAQSDEEREGEEESGESEDNEENERDEETEDGQRQRKRVKRNDLARDTSA